MKRPPVLAKTVCITGCSTGIGKATAELMQARGWKVFPSARSERDLATLREQGFDPIPLDLSDSASVQAAAESLRGLCPEGLGVLVNNAGIGHLGAVEDFNRSAMEHQFSVNLIGMQELTNAIIPDMRKQGYGRIINVSSVLGRVSVPFTGLYSATKFAMEAISDAMRLELYDAGIGVSLVEPGPIQTEFRENSVRHVDGLRVKGSEFENWYIDEFRSFEESRYSRRRMLPATAVAEKIFHAANSRSPKRRYCVTLNAYAGAVLRRFAPYSLTDALFRSKVAQALLKPKS